MSSNEDGATCCYLTPKKMLTYNDLVWHFPHVGNYFCRGLLGVTFRHVLAEKTTGRCS